MNNIELHTKRLVLREWTPKDVEDLKEGLNKHLTRC